MYSKNLSSFVWYGFGLVILTLATFGALRWLQIPSGRMIDWIIGILSFWWLLIISTVPWNTYFEAKGVLADAEQSERTEIKIDKSQLDYVRMVSKRSLLVAIGLHLVSAIALFLFSASGISPVGYIASAAALLLTALRPAVRAYEYLWERLASIRHLVRFPREDVADLSSRIRSTQSKVDSIELQLDASKPGTLAYEQEHSMNELRHLINRVTKSLDQLEHQNRVEHDQLARDSQNNIAKISADTQFLDHVREIVRMIKIA